MDRSTHRCLPAWWLSIVILVTTTLGCGSPPLMLPTAQAPAPDACMSDADSNVLLAGVGKVDITPPPDVGLSGYGTESVRAAGYRHRLYARALVLQDARGERVALLVVDLSQVSAVLHRLTADRLTTSSCLGADRLMISATHTHAGPGHFFTSTLVNEAGSSVSGFDSLVVDFLVSRFSRAVDEAAANLRPAVAGWGTATVWGHTRNRSWAAYNRNRPRPRRAGLEPTGDVALDPTHLAVDPSLIMLRVDTIGTLGDTIPVGAFSVFAMHATGNPALNDLFDGDIHALVERGLEEHIDGRRVFGRAPQSVHLFANGSVGDVSPDWPQPPENRLCPVPTLRRARGRAGPRSPLAPMVWKGGPQSAVDRCLAESRRYIHTVGDSVAQHAIRLFDSIGRAGLSGELRVARVFRTLNMKEDAGALGVCPNPRAGTSPAGGAPDGRSRVYGWKVFGVFPTGFDDEGGGVKTDDDPCHSPKRIGGGPLQRTLLGGHAFPEQAQLMILEIGSGVVVATPWEMTTVVGQRIKASIEQIARDVGRATSPIAIVGLANGYLQYLTTADEYAVQRYEGGSNLYGPRTAEGIGHQLDAMASVLLADSITVADVGPITAFPGPQRRVFPTPDRDQPPERAFRTMKISRDTVVLRWTDAYPGDLVPADAPVLLIQRETSSGDWESVAWDDDRFVEVRAIDDVNGHDYLWEVRWTGCRSGAMYRIQLLARSWHDLELDALRSASFSCGPAPRE